MGMMRNSYKLRGGIVMTKFKSSLQPRSVLECAVWKDERTLADERVTTALRNWIEEKDGKVSCARAMFEAEKVIKRAFG